MLLMWLVVINLCTINGVLKAPACMHMRIHVYVVCECACNVCVYTYMYSCVFV